MQEPKKSHGSTCSFSNVRNRRSDAWLLNLIGIYIFVFFYIYFLYLYITIFHIKSLIILIYGTTGVKRLGGRVLRINVSLTLSVAVWVWMLPLTCKSLVSWKEFNLFFFKIKTLNIGNIFFYIQGSLFLANFTIATEIFLYRYNLQDHWNYSTANNSRSTVNDRQ